MCQRPKSEHFPTFRTKLDHFIYNFVIYIKRSRLAKKSSDFGRSVCLIESETGSKAICPKTELVLISDFDFIQ